MKNYNNFIKERQFWGSGKNNHFNGKYIFNNKDSYKYIGYNVLDFEKIYDDVTEINKSDIEDYISLETIKNMFPIYNKFDFKNDWSVKTFKYKNYLIIQASGYYYVFKKIN